ncbi:MAG: HAD family hydrolase [Solirubrobacteraceae bacterium]
MCSDRPRIAFDLDGTLLDARERQVGLAMAISRRCRWTEFDGRRFWSAKRRGATTVQALLRMGAALALAERIGNGWQAQIEHPRWLALDRPLPGVPRVLERVIDSGFAPVLLTARRDSDALQNQLRTLGLHHLLDQVHVVCPDRITTEKAAVLRRPSILAYVGDTEADAAAAAAAHVPFAAAASGQRNRSFLRARGIERVFPAVGGAVDALLSEVLADVR